MILRIAMLLFGVFCLGVFSAENRIEVHFLNSVLVMGPQGRPAAELDNLILDDVCRVRRNP